MLKGQKYSQARLHSFRHMAEYVAQIRAGLVTPERKEVLKQRLASVKETARSMHADAYAAIQKMDGEQMHDPNVVWDNALEAMKYIKPHYAEYTWENLHVIRHFEAYMEEITKGDITTDRRVYLKECFGKVMKMATHAYYDAERLLLKLE